MCNTNDETLEHFLLECTILESIRSNVLCDIDDTLFRACGKQISDFEQPAKIQILLDSTFLHELVTEVDEELLPELEHHTRRLCYILHGERQKYLLKTECRRRKGGSTQL